MRPNLIDLFRKKTKTMHLGDKVKHQSGAFDFQGEVIALFVTRNNRNMAVVEQFGTSYLQMFGIESLNVLDGLEAFGPSVIHPPKPVLPVKIKVPVRIAMNGKKAEFKNDVRLNYLPKRPTISLITDSVSMVIEYHFTTPHSVGDLDNLTKVVLDLIKDSILYDDAQVKELTCRFVTNSDFTGFTASMDKYGA